MRCRYVGYALTTQWAGSGEGMQVIGFDMGGTSTDVSRFAGTYEHVFESTTAGTCSTSPVRIDPTGLSMKERPGSSTVVVIEPPQHECPLARETLARSCGCVFRGDHSGSAAGHQHSGGWRRLPPLLPPRTLPGAHSHVAAISQVGLPLTLCEFQI